MRNAKGREEVTRDILPGTSECSGATKKYDENIFQVILIYLRLKCDYPD